MLRVIRGVVFSMVVGSLALAGCGGGGQEGGEITGTVAIAATGLGADGFNYTQGTYVTGFVFRLTTPIQITHLGYYDANLAGAADAFGSHAVGVYDLSTDTLLGSATVTGSDPARAIFRYAALDSPIDLGTADTYAVVGVTGSSYYTIGITFAEAPVDPALIYVCGAGYSTTASNDHPTETSTLIEPNAFDAGNVFGEPPPADMLANFGPNFIFAPRS